MSHLFDQIVTCIDQTINAHVCPEAPWNLPAAVIDPFKRTIKSFFSHGLVPCFTDGEFHPATIRSPCVQGRR